MRTRKLASDRQKEKNFIGGSAPLSCAGSTRASIHLHKVFKMDRRVKPVDDKSVAAVLRTSRSRGACNRPHSDPSRQLRRAASRKSDGVAPK